MNTDQQTPGTRQAVTNGLAVVGFIFIVGAGIWLAVYSTRFVPSVVNGIGGAAVYLGAIFTPADDAELSVLPTLDNQTESTALPFDDKPIVDPIEQDTVEIPIKPTVKPSPTVIAGDRTNVTHQISGATSIRALSGLPDFVSNITAIGYLATPSTESFVASTTVPFGYRPAVKFTIKNIGTNSTGQWRFSASIPTERSYIYHSPFQQSLNPGERIDYTLGFDHAIAGSNRMISISPNFDRPVVESTYDNNNASVQLTILGR